MLFKDIKCPNCSAYHDPTLQKCPECHNSNELFKLNRVPKRAVFLHPVCQIAMFIIGFAYAGMLFTEYFYAIFIRSMDTENILFKSALLLTLTYVTMFFALLAVPLLSRKKLFFSKFNSGIDYIYGLAFAITLLAAGAMVSAIVSIWHTPADNVNQTDVVSIAKSYPLIAIFIMGFIGPICEELTYRVGLYSFLRRINKYLALIVTAVVFALIHFTFDADDIIEELWSFPSYLVSGVLLTLAYEQRGPACSITAHVCYNLIAILMTMVAR